MTATRSLFLALVLAAPAAAFAGDNRAFLEQRGSDNHVMIDQSAASSSLVAGLSNWSSLAPLAPPPTDKAELPDYFDGIFPSETSADRFLQQGDHNTAHVSISGGAAMAVLMQLGSHNVADMALSEDWARGMILQDGDGHNGTVHVSGVASWGILEQTGGANTGRLKVESADTRVLYRQSNGIQDVGPVVITQDSMGEGGGVITISRH